MGKHFLEFLDFVRGMQLRFYQERDLGLDLYHSGWAGVLLAGLAVAALLVFVLAIFHVIPKVRHVTGLLLCLGMGALLLGAGTSYAHFRGLPEVEPHIIRATAGPPPVNDAQRAAVVSLPLAVGALTFAGSTLGCAYMAIFWGGVLLKKKAAAGPTSR